MKNLILVAFVLLTIVPQLHASPTTNGLNKYCGTWCVELVPYGKTLLKRICDGNGEVIKAEQTDIPADTAFEITQPTTRDPNSGAPQPPAGGTGVVSETTTSPGMNTSGQTGTWYSTTNWYFQSGVVVNVVNTIYFQPGGVCPEWDPCTHIE